MTDKPETTVYGDAPDAISIRVDDAYQRGYAKALEKAAAVCRAQTQGIELEDDDWHAGWTHCAEACADEILALKKDTAPAD
jgi:hypothetical protein